MRRNLSLAGQVVREYFLFYCWPFGRSERRKRFARELCDFVDRLEAEEAARREREWWRDR